MDNTALSLHIHPEVMYQWVSPQLYDEALYVNYIVATTAYVWQ
jgi:hypothetical protein